MILVGLLMRMEGTIVVQGESFIKSNSDVDIPIGSEFGKLTISNFSGGSNSVMFQSNASSLILRTDYATLT